MPPYRDKDGCVDYRRQTRTKQNVYECPPPPPEVLQCSICGTAECEGSNIWNSVPFVSYSTMFGPTLFDILIHVLNLLPLSVICWLGIGHHKKCCAVKPPVFNYDPLNETPKKKYQDHPKGEGSNDSLSGWMHDEYLSLAKELADLRKLTCERRDEDDPDNRDLLQARNYVLDRLAEMLAKREEIERRMKKKKQKSQS
ncbi:uncharacterized protein LOC124363904 [Homalodisca vitripennis]|uniref:uncharacterized protein LOC124363904 n=1 Tax=Homalodisca vitripennis TaxID=197043 RepID=UPI001EEBF8AC|nr:uncharacterized protein LOC124363904 [Homalodisca vitripennis]